MMRGLVTQGLAPTRSGSYIRSQQARAFGASTLIEEVAERVDYKGAISSQLICVEAEAVVQKLADGKIDSVAICLLWSVANDAHEKALAELFRRKCPSVFFNPIQRNRSFCRRIRARCDHCL